MPPLPSRAADSTRSHRAVGELEAWVGAEEKELLYCEKESRAAGDGMQCKVIHFGRWRTQKYSDRPTGEECLM